MRRRAWSGKERKPTFDFCGGMTRYEYLLCEISIILRTNVASELLAFLLKVCSTTYWC